MKNPPELVRDMYALLDELNTPAFPAGITEMDVVRFLSHAMPETERQEFERIMERNPGFKAEVGERRRLDEKLFSEESLDKYEAEIFAAFGIEKPVNIWEVIREKGGAVCAETIASLRYAYELVFRNPLECGTRPGPFWEGIDHRLTGRAEPDFKSGHIQIVVQIESPDLKGTKCRLAWFESGVTGSDPVKRYSEEAKLESYSDEAQTVTARFSLDEARADGAMKTGFTIEPVDK